MKTINEKIKKLELEVEKLKRKIKDLSIKTDTKKTKPYSKVGGTRAVSQNKSVSLSSGLSRKFGGNIIWNNVGMGALPYGQKPNESDLTTGFNKHGHSKFAGGALDINTLELVEYDCDWSAGDWSKHFQELWKTSPSIKKVERKDGTLVEKIGNLDIEFDAESGKWIASAGEIDVEKTNLVMKDEGEIKKDSKDQEMKAPLYNSDENKTCVVWDEDAEVWRFYAVYAD